MTDRELMQMALDAMELFESGTNGLYKGEFADERKALRDRLAQPEREWVGLTDEEIRHLQAQCHLKDVGYDTFIMRFARAILRKAQEK